MSCLECVRKHVGEAIWAAEEALLGYPHHATLAVGAFSHATSEALKAFPALANQIRAARLAFERCMVLVLTGTPIDKIPEDAWPDVEGLMLTIHEMILAELLGGETQKGVRSVRAALGVE